MIKLGLSKAEVSGQGSGLPDGDFDVELQRVIYKPSANPREKGNDIFIVEFVVQEIRWQKAAKGSELKFDRPEVVVGEKRSWTANTKYTQTAGRIRQFLFAATGADKVDEGAALFQTLCTAYKIDPAKFADLVDPWDKIGSLAVSEVNPFAGLKVRVQVHGEGTNSNRSFPVHDWAALEEAAAA